MPKALRGVGKQRSQRGEQGQHGKAASESSSSVVALLSIVAGGPELEDLCGHYATASKHPTAGKLSVLSCLYEEVLAQTAVPSLEQETIPFSSWAETGRESAAACRVTIDKLLLASNGGSQRHGSPQW